MVPGNQQPMMKRQYAFSAEKLLRTINFDLEDIKEWAILDSGATSHFLVMDAPVDEVKRTNKPINIRQPDGAIVTSTHTCSLKIPGLPLEAKLGHIVPGLASHLLLSVVRLLM